MKLSIESFFRENPVFTREFFEQTMGYSNYKNTAKNTLAHHIKQGHIVRIRRGLFASIPYGSNPISYPINPYLVAQAMTKDAIIGYHTALSYYGAAYSSSYRFTYLTQSKAKPMMFRDIHYQPVAFPKQLLESNKTHCYINREDIQGVDVSITSKERMLVDCMDRPFLGGGWEEVYRSLDSIERFNIKNIVDYALLINKATTIAKTGFYLEQRQHDLSIDDKYFECLEKNIPKSPNYIDLTKKTNNKFIKRWNLFVPESILCRNWEEITTWKSQS